MTLKKRIVFAAAATGLGLLFGLILLELSVRIFLVRRAGYIDQFHEQVSREWGGDLTLFDLSRAAAQYKRVYELIPGANGTFLGQPLRINSDGFWDIERQQIPSPGKARVAVLGDSVAFGWGVSAQQRFSNLLEDLLLSSGTKCEVLNFAVPGYNTVMELATFRDKVLAYSPDILLLSLVDNDDEVPNFVRIKPQAWSLRHLFILETIRDQLIGRKLGDTARLALGGIAEAGGVGHARKVIGFRPDLVPPEYRFLVGEQAMGNALTELSQEARVHGIEPVCITHRSLSKPDANAHGHLKSERLVRLAAGAGFKVIDPAPAILKYLEQRNLADKALWVRHDDAHPNPTAHKLLAEQTAPVLLDVLSSRTSTFKL